MLDIEVAKEQRIHKMLAIHDRNRGSGTLNRDIELCKLWLELFWLVAGVFSSVINNFQ